MFHIAFKTFRYLSRRKITHTCHKIYTCHTCHNWCS